jgi:hypothetical protein
VWGYGMSIPLNEGKFRGTKAAKPLRVKNDLSLTRRTRLRTRCPGRQAFVEIVGFHGLEIKDCRAVRGRGRSGENRREIVSCSNFALQGECGANGIRNRR